MKQTKKSGNLAKGLAVLLLLCILLASCGEAAQSGTSDTPPSLDSTAAAETEAPETETPIPDPPEGDYDGYVFRIGQRETTTVKEYLPVVPELNGDVLNDAVYERNRNVEEKLKVKIQSADTSSFATLKKAILANDDLVDITHSSCSDVFPVLGEGLFIDLDTIKSLDIESIWWDQNANEELSILGKHFVLTGDMITTDELHTVCLIYSTNLFNDFGFGSPYGMVSDGTWTLDRFLDMARQGAADLDGDGKMGEYDRWGFTTEGAMLRWLCESFGLRSLKKSDSSITIDVTNDRNLAVTDAVLRLATEKDAVTFAEDGIITDGTYGGVFYHMEALFAEDKALFHSGTFDDLTRMRTYDADYGIVPLPKYNESQDTYYHSVSWSNEAIFVPVTNTDPERTGVILENMGWESYKNFNTIFYDIFMSEKLTRDENSKALLDIIFSTKYYDLDDFINLSGLRTIVYNIGTKKENTFASDWAANAPKAEEKLNTYLKAFQ